MDGLPDRKTLRRMRYAAHQCLGCRRLYRKKPAKCSYCDSAKFESISLLAHEFCTAFGHNNTEALIPGSERTEYGSGPQDKGKNLKDPVVSHEYNFYCVRCGLQQKRRRVAGLANWPGYKPAT
jgi:hypothetical protein